MSMRNALLPGAVAALFGSSSAQAQGTVKIGVILPIRVSSPTPATSSTTASSSTSSRTATPSPQKIEVIRKDVAASRRTSPSGWRRNWSCATRWISSRASRSHQRARRRRRLRRAKKFMSTCWRRPRSSHQVSLHGAVSFTTPQLNDTLGAWAYRSGLRKVYSMVADFALT